MKRANTIINLKPGISRFYLLDISRTIAAFCVILQHYQLFYYTSVDGKNSLSESFSRDQQPFYEYIEFFYSFGSVAVQYFFVLSGFVFFSVYNDKVYHKIINLKSFFILRFSRLYPLVILTLLLVAILQYVYIQFSNHFFYISVQRSKTFHIKYFHGKSMGFSRWRLF